MELLFDIWIDFDVFGWLVLNVGVEIFINNFFEFIKVIDVLDAPIYCILELSDLDIILSDLGSVFFDHLYHVLLSCLQIIDNVTEVGVDLIVVPKILVHFIGLLLEPRDLLTPWSNISFKFLDFIVKHKLELF